MARAGAEQNGAAAVGVAGVEPVLYILLTVLLGLLWEVHDPIRDTQSELGAVDSPYQGLMNVAGLGMVIVGFFACDPGCVDVTATGRLHGVVRASGAIGLPAAGNPLRMGVRPRRPLSTRWQVLSLLVGVLTLASGPVIQAGFLTDATCMLQRASMWPALLWITAVFLRLLTLTWRAPPAASGSVYPRTHHTS